MHGISSLQEVATYRGTQSREYITHVFSTRPGTQPYQYAARFAGVGYDKIFRAAMLLVTQIADDEPAEAEVRTELVKD